MSENPAANLPPVEPVASPKKRRWWLWGCFIIPLIVFAVVAAGYLILDWRVERHLEDVKAHLSFKLVPAKDLPTLWGPAPKPEDNAAPIYDEISKKLSAWGNLPNAEEQENEFERLEVIWGVRGPESWPEDQPNPIMDKIVKDVMKNGKHVGTPEEIASLFGQGGKPPPIIPTRDPARVQKFLDQFFDVFKLRDEAALRTGYRTDTNWSDFHSNPILYVELLRLDRLSILQSAVAAEEGHWDEAYAALFPGGILVHHLEQEKYQFLLLIEITLRGTMARSLSDLIHRHPPSSKQAEELHRLLMFDAKIQLRDNLIGECVLENGFYEKLLSGKRQPNKALFKDIVRLNCLYLNDDRTFLLEMLDSFIRATEFPLDRSLSEMPSVEKRFKDASLWRFINSRGILPAIGISNTLKMCVRCQASEEMLLVALDLAAYRQEHGKYPAALADLPNAAKLPRDPFTETGAGGPENEQPFHYRLVGEGFVLWSVGPEGKDGAETTLETLENPDGTHVYLRVPPKAWEEADKQ